MKLYINNPTEKTIETIKQINEIIERLNNLCNLADKYNACQNANNEYRTGDLPFYEEQEIHYATLISKLERQQTEIENELSNLSALQVLRKKDLSTQLVAIKNEIDLHNNNYSRIKNGISRIISEINQAEAFIKAYPINATTEAHKQIIQTELNPAIKELSKLTNTPIVTYDTKSIFLIERFELADEDKFELV